MLEEIKYFFKKYWVLFPFIVLISIPLFVVSVVRTNRGMTLKGDTTTVQSVLDVDTDYVEEGSFSTIYVMSMDKSTILQNQIAKSLKTVETYDMGTTGTTHLTAKENQIAGQIQHNSSMTNSMVYAYKKAHEVDERVTIDYTFAGFDITYYAEGSQFHVGDRIVKINSQVYGLGAVDTKDEALFRKVINLKKYIGDIYTVARDGVQIDITLGEKDSFFAYSMYQIHKENTYPSYTERSTNVGGPSGGLLQTLSIYNQLVEEDLTHGYRIAGTGTLNYLGQVGAIGGIREKIPTALDDHIDIFLCVAANYEEALEAYNSIPGHSRMRLVKIATFDEAIEYLTEGYKNDFRS